MLENNFLNSVKTIAIPDVYIEQGSVDKLLIEAGITVENVVKVVQNMVENND